MSYLLLCCSHVGDFVRLKQDVSHCVFHKLLRMISSCGLFHQTYRMWCGTALLPIGPRE